MLTDIVARLRDPRWTHPPHSLLLEAADEVERLRQALMQIANPDGLASRHETSTEFDREFSTYAREIARDALTSGQ